jgi:selenocysteine lyase/cysteine desulfurase
MCDDERVFASRRSILATAAGAVAVGSLAGCKPDASKAPAFDAKDWASVRAQFALQSGGSHFDAFVFASHPASVRAAIERHRAALDADAHGYVTDNQQAFDQAVAKAAGAYLRTQPDQIAFTDSTTMGLGLLYSGLRLQAGDHVLTTEHDFYSTHESLRLRQVRDGISVSRVRLYDDGEPVTAEQIVSRLRAGIQARTRAVAVTWVHSGTGVKLPIRMIADALAEVNNGRAPAERVLLCVDGVHGFAAENTDVAELRCDFLVSGTHKWLFGPRGTGLIWGSADGWARVTGIVPTFTADATDPRAPAGPVATPGGYHSFEHRWALADAFAFHHAIGPDRVTERTRTLASALKAGLAAMPKVRLITPIDPQLSAGVVCCDVSNLDARAAVARLKAVKILASATPYETSYLRFGTSIVTDESDVDAALRAVRGLV